ncbi:MAG: multicopper oxidase domain-containing protein [Candidatus Poribacteria bacterium]|nr:multicopper oxidase domain-containing protein [Candidatus Poribacteria bacterium]
MENTEKRRLSRRNLFKGFMGITSVAGVTAVLANPSVKEEGSISTYPSTPAPHNAHTQMGVVGDVRTNGFNPTQFLTDFDYGEDSKTLGGQTVREYTVVAEDVEIEIAPGIFFPAWTYNGTVPGPTLRCTEGDLFRVHFTNTSSHPHTIHFHGIHPGNMDGVFEIVHPGDSFTYEFTAAPYGLHLYHCHSMPLKRHIHKGLYGAFIIDPKDGRPMVKEKREIKELVMVMNGFDTNFDGDNEVYAVNTVAFHYQRHQIQLRLNEPVRVYLVNVTEFDPINSFHLHGEFFEVYRTGATTTPEYTDTVMVCQGERHILEFSFKYPGKYMFHAHQSEFAELGWMGIFDVIDQEAPIA